MYTVTTIEQAASALEVLGLDEDRLAGVLHRGLAGFGSCTELDAPSRASTELYFEVVRGLREWLLTMPGWEYDNAGGQPRVFNADRGVAIVFASGDENTGNPYAQPKTKQPKGEVTLTKIAVNKQLTFPLVEFDERPDAGAAQSRTGGLTTHVLLVHVAQGRLTAELSIPADTNAASVIDTWTGRIMLNEINPTPAMTVGEERATATQFRVDVARR